MYKSLLCSLVIISIFTSTLFTGCSKLSNACNDPVACKKIIEKNLKTSNTEEALLNYVKYTDLTQKEDICILNNISRKTLENIYNGKVFYGKEIEFLVLVDKLYEKSGIPVVGEKIGTQKVASVVSSQKKIAKAVAASFLQTSDDMDYVDSVLDLLKDPDPIVRGTTATSISSIKTKKYLPPLQDVYDNDKEAFVKYYALKGLGLNDYEANKTVIIETFEKGTLLGQIISAGTLLYNDDNRGVSLLKRALNSDSEIVILRALEALILNDYLLEEDQLITFLNSENFLKSLYSARILGNSNDPKHLEILKKELYNSKNKNKFALSVGLLEANDLSGLNHIQQAMISKDFTFRLFASKAIIDYCINNNHCDN